jgi:hypothetical protein
MSGTQQLLVIADSAILLEENIITIEKNTYSLVDTSKEVYPET